VSVGQCAWGSVRAAVLPTPAGACPNASSTPLQSRPLLLGPPICMFISLSKHLSIEIKTWSYQTLTVFVFDACDPSACTPYTRMYGPMPPMLKSARLWLRARARAHTHTHTQIKRTDQELDLGLDIVAKGMTRLKGMLYAVCCTLYVVPCIFFLFAYLLSICLSMNVIKLNFYIYCYPGVDMSRMCMKPLVA